MRIFALCWRGAVVCHVRGLRGFSCLSADVFALVSRSHLRCLLLLCVSTFEVLLVFGSVVFVLSSPTEAGAATPLSREEDLCRVVVVGK